MVILTGAGRPASPWRTRFGRPHHSSILFDEPDCLHSFLAPRYPSLDARFYETIPPKSEFARPASDKELDGVFLREGEQCLQLRGILSWQVPTLNSLVNLGPRLGPIPGGHDPSAPVPVSDSDLASHLIQVDETQWLSFFRKENWYNSAYHSVDDPKLWSILRVGVELADRIIKALISDQHEALQTALYGRIDFWDAWRADAPRNNDIVILSLAEERAASLARGIGLPCSGDYMTQYGAKDWLERLLELVNGVRWYYSDISENPEMSGSTEGLDNCRIGVRVNLPSPPSFDDSKCTLAEMTLVLHDLGITIVHELFHAIARHRLYRDRRNRHWAYHLGWDRRDGEFEEPYVDFEREREWGRAFESRIFGGSAGIFQRNEIPFTTYCRSWPDGLRVSRTTSWYASQMLSESFWHDDSKPRKSDNYFYRQRIFFSAAQFPITRPIDGVEISASDDVNSDEYRLLVGPMIERKQIWTSRRAAWFPEAEQTWMLSQWGYHEVRRTVDQLSTNFAELKEYDGALAARDLANYASWQDGPLFMSKLPATDQFIGNWVFFAIGLLFMAAAPVRDFDITKPYTDMVGDFKLEPCAEAQKSGNARPTHGHYDNGLRRIGPSQLWDWLIVGGEIQNPTQQDYIVVVENLLDFVTSDMYLVSLPWYKAVQNLLYDVKAQRQQLEAQLPLVTAQGRWIDRWTFETPTYSSTPELSAYNAAEDRWQRVEFSDDTFQYEFV